MQRCRGMTLMEVLVALVVVSVAVLALARSGASSIDTHHQVANRTFALMVAQNALAEISLTQPSTPSRRQGQMSLANQTWTWQAVIGPTPDGSMLRVDVGVSTQDKPNDTLVMQTGFIAP